MATRKRKRPETLNLVRKLSRDDTPSHSSSQDTGIFSSTSEGESQESQEDEQLDHAELIRQNYVQLVENLQTQLFLHLLPTTLCSSIDEGMKKKDKTRTLLDVLSRSPSIYFNKFCEAIAGLHPTLFELLRRRKPTQRESEAYLKQFCDELRKGILRTGSKTDNSIDPRIDLDSQFVTLKLTKASVDQYLHPSQLMNEQDDVLPQFSFGKTTLVTGRAGVGKSTLIQFLARKWAKGKWASEFSAVFLLNLRMLAHLQREMTISQLLSMYAEYVPDPLDEMQPPVEWLENNQEKILIFTDGIDELTDLNRILNKTPKFSLSMKATPLEWCVTLIQRNVLQKCTLLLISRPFSGLSKLSYHANIDVLGLTPDKVLRFVELNIREDRQVIVKETLFRNPVLLSICSITFYCAAISKILEENERIDGSSLTTYTRIMTFIITSLASRRAGKEMDALIMSDDLYECLPHLAELAFKGLSENEAEVTRLVFHEQDFNDIGFLDKRIHQARQTGLLICKEMRDPLNSDKHKTFQAEFVHVSIQELFAAAHMMKFDVKAVEAHLKDTTFSGRFNMSQLFLFGLALDKENIHISGIKKAILKANHSGHQDESNKDIESLLLTEFRKLLTKAHDSELMLQAVQTAYESQSPDMAVEVGAAVAPEKELTLPNIQLTAIDMKALFFMMKHSVIERLSFQETQIDNASAWEISMSLHEMKYLQSLLLYDNNIEEEGMEHIANAIKKSASLHQLHLEQEQVSPAGMKHISEAIQSSASLDRVVLSTRQISTESMQPLCEAISTSSNLTELCLSRNHLTDEAMALLSEALIATSALNQLQLFNNDLSTEGIKHLSMAIKSGQSLHELELSSNQIDDDGMWHLAEAIGSCTSLFHLRLWDNRLTTEGMRHLASGILNSKSLRKLQVLSNHITPEGMQHLEHALKTNKSLTSLELGDNQLTPESIKHLSSGVVESHGLNHLELLSNQITEDAMEHLSQAIKMASSLRELHLFDNQLSTEGIWHLGDAIKTTHSLTHLQLTNNKITASGMSHLAEAIRMTPTLKHLQFSSIPMDDESMRIFSEGLKFSSSLTDLVLWDNELTANGFSYLSNAVRVATRLNHLQLVDNPITVDCMQPLSDAIQVSTTLSRLVLCHNRMDSAAMKLLCEGLKCTKSLTHLQVIENGMTEESLKHLAGVIKLFTSLRCLQLAFNHIAIAGMQHLVDSVRCTPRLTHLQLVNNQVTSEGRTLLFKSTQSLRNLKFEDLPSEPCDNTLRAKVDMCNREFLRFTKLVG